MSLAQNNAVDYLIVLHLDVDAAIGAVVLGEGLCHDDVFDLAELGEVILDVLLGDFGVNALDEDLVVVVVDPDVESLVAHLEGLELVELFT